MNKPANVIMVQGTSSHAGKSILATALCRIFAQDGYQVAPFKAQNMSLNSFVTPDGGEIGRSQAVQAAAAMVEPRVEMNPVLLKPEAEARSQVVVMGRPQARKSAREYYELKQQLWPVITSSLDALRREYDIVVIEGAGSPAEINLKQHDIVNMRVARYADSPVLLVGDIDRGGVFAQIVGTMVLLEAEEQALVTGHVINKFRGDPSLLTSGLHLLEEHTGAPALGVLPYYFDIHVPEEDSLGLQPDSLSDEDTLVDVAVMRLPHIANFDDFDPLRHERGVRLRYVRGLDEFGQPDLIVIPGSKTTVDDLDWLRSQGLADKITALRETGTPVIGICAGFQMLGRELHDPSGVESSRSVTSGLGLLPTSTTFQEEKVTHQVSARVAEGRGLLGGCYGAALSGYEIHMGVTAEGSLSSPFLVESRSGDSASAPDGALDADGLTLGTYMHGLFHSRKLRRSVLDFAAERRGVAMPQADEDVDLNEEYDKLAALVREHLDMDHIRRAMGLPD
ncbi:MAG: cobyric acid synthase [Chloroflexi bacterium]|nr:cobyric acid synthase [Chloroflexota bacterium]MCY3684836.1 cobyric acid synthase [Chloroflexota bacterium]